MEKHWYSTGNSRLEAIQGDSQVDCLRQMLSTCLQKNYNTERFGQPTWVRLVEAVNNSAGWGNPSLTMKIAKDHGGTYWSKSLVGFHQGLE